MVVDYVTLINMDMLYNLIASGKLSKNYQHNAGNNLNKILSHVQISFGIHHINLFESFIMKLFTNSELIIRNKYSDFEYNNDSKKEINLAEDMTSLVNSINENTKIPNINNYFFPVKYVYEDIEVALSGTHLFSVFGSLPDIFFKKVFKFKEDTDFTETIPDEEILKNEIISEFVTNFYKYYQSYVNSVDILTDSFIYSKYFSKVKTTSENVTLMDIHTPYANIDCTKKMENNKADINRCHSLFEYEYITHDCQYKNTFAYFTINCNFYTFLEMFMALPIRFFVDFQDVKTLLSKDAVLLLPENLNQYKIRLNTKINEFVKIRDEMASSKTEPLRKFYYIMLNSAFKFNMKLSLDDITSTILKYFYTIDNSKDLISNNIFNILNQIINSSKKIYKMLSSTNNLN